MFLSPEDRSIIIDCILESDLLYLETLLQRRAMIKLELQRVEGSIVKKSQEINSLRCVYAG